MVGWWRQVSVGWGRNPAGLAGSSQATETIVLIKRSLASMGKQKLAWYQINLRDTMILALGTCVLMGITITRVKSYRALHVELRDRLEESYELELSLLVMEKLYSKDNADRDWKRVSIAKTQIERLLRAEAEIARLEKTTEQHTTTSFVLLGVASVFFAACILIPRLWLRWVAADDQSQCDG